MSKNALPPPYGKENSKPAIFVNHNLTEMLLIPFLPEAAKAREQVKTAHLRRDTIMGSPMCCLDKVGGNQFLRLHQTVTLERHRTRRVRTAPSVNSEGTESGAVTTAM